VSAGLVAIGLVAALGAARQVQRLPIAALISAE